MNIFRQILELLSTLVYDHTFTVWSVMAVFYGAACLLLAKGIRFKLAGLLIVCAVYFSGFLWLTPLLKAVELPGVTSAPQEKYSRENAEDFVKTKNFNVYEFPQFATLWQGNTLLITEGSYNNEKTIFMSLVKGRVTQEQFMALEDEEIFSITQRKAPQKSPLEETCNGQISNEGDLFSCKIVGQTKNRDTIIGNKSGLSYDYIVDIQGTRVTVKVKADGAASQDVIKLLDSAKVLDESTLRLPEIKNL